MMVGVQLVGAPLGLGFVAALAYFGLLRPRLVAAVPTLPALAAPPADPDHPLSSANVLPASGMPGDRRLSANARRRPLPCAVSELPVEAADGQSADRS
jgi:hypothetical protein